ncbi:DUF935 domain-containing protein [Acinetobacter sp. NIPH 1958]|uniref:DUF935 domain-containing protein n=1 Tax=Acinetobacter sp. NIPH 1958 TaxID=2923430 RepID=UPI001F4AD0D6|nr:DUF935 domain-containing protein [Acinetobacter sp. NIPH 1958]MCH7357440.1 DUF935 domain-containing protein [Acinetobacter sp. NIPH 1958]
MVQNPQTVFASIMAKKDRSSKKQDRTALASQQTAEVSWLSSQWQEHPVVGMTPQRLHQLLTDAEQGNLQAQADLFCDMEERDGHIFSEMDKRKKGVNKLAWGVNPPKRASEQEKKIAEEIQEWIDDIKDFEMFLFNAMDAVGHGYSCQQIHWHQMGNLWLPKNFEHIGPRNFMTPHNQLNCLRLNDGSVEGAEFWDFGWFNHLHQAKSGYISRSGLYRVLAWPFVFKNYSVRDVMEFLEIYGLPIRIGKYPSGATAEEKMTLQRAVMMIGRQAGGTIPQGMSIDFQSAADGDTANHMNMIKYFEQIQSKVIVGGTLLSQADGKTSTNAQSKTHEIQFAALVKSDAKQLARSISDNLIDYLMRLNYPHIPKDRYPEFYFDTSEIEDMEVFSNSLEKLVNVGMKIPLSWAHEKLGIPQPADDKEPVLGIAQPQIPSLALNTFQPNLLNGMLAANSAQLPIEEQAIQLLLKDQTQTTQTTAEEWTKHLLAKLEAGNEEEVLAILQDVYPMDDEPALQEKLTRLIFAAEVMGRLSVESEQS